MIRRAKTHTLSSQIIDVGKDTKKLFSLINTITGSKKTNPLPPSTSDEELAEEFATFFMSKIRKIRHALDTHPKFKPTWHNNSKSFVNFTKLVEDEAEKNIMSMPTKSCKLDVLQTKVLKEIIKLLFPCSQKLSTYH